MDKQTKIARIALVAGCIMILFLLAMACLDIYLEGVGFSRETIVERLGIIGPMLAVSAAVAVIAAATLFGSRKKNPEKKAEGLYKAPGEGKKGGKMWSIMLPLALLLIALGAYNGGARDVFVKAVNICTECIGLG